MAEKTGIEELRVKEILKERGMKMYELAKKMDIAPERPLQIHSVYRCVIYLRMRAHR